MRGKPPKKQSIVRWLKRNFLWICVTFILIGAIALSLMIGSWWLLLDRPALQAAKNSPIDSILVLGGSIRREMYAAKLAKQNPQIPIIISSGSLAPCIWLIFQQDRSPMERVWLQNCATSTFKNYYFALPLLKQWGVRHVKIVTSQTHLPRAKWLAQILLNSHGIWAELDAIVEEGIPGNQESWTKTVLDLTRSLMWARVSHYYSPECLKLNSLLEVELAQWEQQGFKCEYQGHLPDRRNVF